MARLDLDLLERSRASIEGDRDAMRTNLVLAAGATMGAGLPGASAAILIILDHHFPEHGVRVEGWRRDTPRRAG